MSSSKLGRQDALNVFVALLMQVDGPYGCLFLHPLLPTLPGDSPPPAPPTVVRSRRFVMPTQRHPKLTLSDLSRCICLLSSSRCSSPRNPTSEAISWR